jgi:hypothetical protein
MLAIFQFPISDTRTFDSELELRLPVPDWPNPNTDINPQFVHYFGKAVTRRFEADQAWPDEIKFCKAARALRFDSLAQHHAGQTGARFRPKCAFRRLFCDGESVVRIEVGLKHHNQAQILSLLTPQQVLSIIIDLCDMPSLVPQTNMMLPGPNNLLKQGPALARLYARGTISHHSSAKVERAEKLVQAGNPLIILELKSHEANFPLVPYGFACIPADKVLGANLAFGRVKTRSGIINTWIIQRGNATQIQARSLRLCILRLHAERETLDLTLKQLKRKTLIIPSEQTELYKLNYYFNKKTKLINRTKLCGISQSAVLEAFDASEQVTASANRLNLFDQYDGAHRQVWAKVDDYQKRRDAIHVVNVLTVNNDGGIALEKHVTVSGTGNIVNVAELISDVTNQVTSNLEKSSSTDEIKELMRQLTEQITAISSQIDPKQTQRIGGDLQTLSNEMAQPEPRQEWYQLSIKGLKEAAEAVGEIGIPIIATLQKLIPLLV